QAFERFLDEAREALLAEALGDRVHGAHALFDGDLRLAGETPVLRMHHLEAVLTVTHLAEAAQARADRELDHLRIAEVEEAQQQGLARFVADRHAQLRPIAETLLDGLDPAFDLGDLAGAQVANRRDARLVLVTQG